MNYNSGEWFGWNGGECPVHGDTVVEGIYWNPEENSIAVQSPITDVGKNFDWKREDDYMLLAFRVIKEHKEPREWVLVLDKYGDVMGDANIVLTSVLYGHTHVKVREVLPD